jgi:release factor glutamine methyltransferase
MGTGSGAIVIALAHEHPEHRYTAMDRSVTALQTARQNARTHRLADRVSWFCGDWNTALVPDREIFDLIVSNPPYIRSGDITGLQTEVREYEPALALDGSGDGLACIRQIVESAHRHLRPGGLIALEMGYDQKRDVASIVGETGRYESLRIVRDYSGHDRVAVMTKNS